MSEYNELYEYEHRYCPICGASVKGGSPLHRCLEKDIKKIDRQNKEADKEEKIKDRSYNDKLNEYDEYYDPEKYYDKDIEEE
jgi:hypothetical protein